MTLDVPADRGSADRVSGPHEWPPSKVASLEMREVRRACMKSSYDEKKRKKSCIASGDLFSAPITDCILGRRFKSAILAANRIGGTGDDSVLPHADSRISDCRCAMWN
ncbi:MULTISPECIES: hypothetical protein [Paraburkholderia]|uniref:hypothetical protein n=1 Tax=Paraburkholderia TaxID=1822464 RepID=UPI0012F6BAA7|nr:MULTISPECIES: hypothetical protein [Paraburkholderia]MDR8395952.1 hypothetical protein [Paraburkholderia sp. USG1]